MAQSKAVSMAIFRCTATAIATGAIRLATARIQQQPMACEECRSRREVTSSDTTASPPHEGGSAMRGEVAAGDTTTPLDAASRPVSHGNSSGEGEGAGAGAGATVSASVDGTAAAADATATAGAVAGANAVTADGVGSEPAAAAAAVRGGSLPSNGAASASHTAVDHSQTANATAAAERGDAADGSTATASIADVAVLPGGSSGKSPTQVAADVVRAPSSEALQELQAAASQVCHGVKYRSRDGRALTVLGAAPCSQMVSMNTRIAESMASLQAQLGGASLSDILAKLDALSARAKAAPPPAAAPTPLSASPSTEPTTRNQPKFRRRSLPSPRGVGRSSSVSFVEDPAQVTLKHAASPKRANMKNLARFEAAARLEATLSASRARLRKTSHSTVSAAAAPTGGGTASRQPAGALDVTDGGDAAPSSEAMAVTTSELADDGGQNSDSTAGAGVNVERGDDTPTRGDSRRASASSAHRQRTEPPRRPRAATTTTAPRDGAPASSGSSREVKRVVNAPGERVALRAAPAPVSQTRANLARFEAASRLEATLSRYKQKLKRVPNARPSAINPQRAGTAGAGATFLYRPSQPTATGGSAVPSDSDGSSDDVAGAGEGSAFATDSEPEDAEASPPQATRRTVVTAVPPQLHWRTKLKPTPGGRPSATPKPQLARASLLTPPRGGMRHRPTMAAVSEVAGSSSSDDESSAAGTPSPRPPTAGASTPPSPRASPSARSKKEKKEKRDKKEKKDKKAKKAKKSRRASAAHVPPPPLPGESGSGSPPGLPPPPMVSGDLSGAKVVKKKKKKKSKKDAK